MLSKAKRRTNPVNAVVLGFARALRATADKHSVGTHHIHAILIANQIQINENRLFTINDLSICLLVARARIGQGYMKVLLNKGLIECMNEKRFYKCKALFNVTEKGQGVVTAFNLALNRVLSEDKDKKCSSKIYKRFPQCLNKARHKDPTPFKKGKR